MLLRFLFLLIFVSSGLSAKNDLSICAIFQDEAPYMKEWIEFHKLQGVQHFYLYNNNSSDEFQEVLNPYLISGEVTLREWPYTYEEGKHGDWIAIQSDAYKDCLKKDGGENRWMAFIDIDEFLFCPKGQKVSEFLKTYHRYPGIGVNWLKFGTSGIEDLNPGTLLIEALVRCSHHHDNENRWYKSIVQPRWVRNSATAHYFFYKKNRLAVDEYKKPLESRNYTKAVTFDKIRINHYWTRTEKYLREKKMPSRIKRRPEFTLEKQMEMVAKYNEHQDDVILQFVAPLKKAMGY